MHLLLLFQKSSILDDYTVNWSQKLGTGVNGPVFRCQRKRTGVEYALKILRDNAQGRREVELHLMCIPHAHVVNIQDVYANKVQYATNSQTGDALLVVMELMKGGELFDRISQAEKFTERNAARFAKQVKVTHLCSLFYEIHLVHIKTISEQSETQNNHSFMYNICPHCTLSELVMCLENFLSTFEIRIK